MKGDSLMSNIDEIILVNENQAKKIKFLEKEKKNYEKHIKDLRQTLTLNKQSLSLMAFSQNNEALGKLNEENIKLHGIVNKFYEESLNFSATLLIEEQLRNQEKKFYNERLLQYENTMNQLRKYLQDKEDSFSAIVFRLRKYEDLNEATLTAKLQKYRKELHDGTFDNLVRQISNERDHYKKIVDEFQINITDFQLLKSCLHNEKSYKEMQQAFKKAEQQKTNNIVSKRDQKYALISQKTKNTTNASLNISSPTKILNPDRQLIRLLKKQKLNNQILQNALNDGIQKNQELIEEINILVQANIELEQTIEKLESRIVLLERELSHFQSIYRYKRGKKSVDDMERIKPTWLQNFEPRGDEEQIHIDSLKEDMEKLSHFLMTCISCKEKNRGCSSSHNLRKNVHEIEDDIIEEGEMEIEQIG